MTGILRTLGLVIAAMLAMPAGAVTWTADERNPTSVQNCAGGVACQYTLVDSSTGMALKLRAYSNSAWMPSSSGGIAPIGSGPGNTYTLDGTNYLNSTGWAEARNIYYSGENAFGISNNIQYQNSEESSFPQLGVDNAEVLDLMVVELPQVSGQTWDLQSFMLGWANENGYAQSDVSMFIGGQNLGTNYDFRNVCFGTSYGGSCGAGQTDLASLGFTDVTTAIANNGNNVPQLSPTGENSTATGNYVVMAGRLGDGDDSFKLKSITAGTVPKTAPVPGTLALLGLGLLGLGWKRRSTRPA